MKFILCPQSRPLSQTLISVDREMERRSNAKTGRNTTGPVNQLISASEETFMTSVPSGRVVLGRSEEPSFSCLLSAEPQTRTS